MKFKRKSSYKQRSEDKFGIGNFNSKIIGYVFLIIRQRCLSKHAVKIRKKINDHVRSKRFLNINHKM